MKNFLLLLSALFLAAAFPLAAQDTSGSSQSQPPAPTYLAPGAINAAGLLPTPPKDDSDDTVKELEVMVQAQAVRTPEQVTRIQQEEHYSVYDFGNVLSAWFGRGTPTTMPATSGLLTHVAADVAPIADAATKDWTRLRPYQVNSRIIPAIEKPEGSSYPSENSVRATVDALVLSELEPNASADIVARGKQIGDDQVIAGVEFPSDVKAGRILGLAIFNSLMADPQFQADLKKAKLEVIAELRKGG